VNLDQFGPAFLSESVRLPAPDVMNTGSLAIVRAEVNSAEQTACGKRA